MFSQKLFILFCFLLPWSIYAQVEICDNGIDDDYDTLIDLNDDDCTCELIEPISVIPNPSFEDMNCCPSSRSQLDCATLWIQASEPTTDFIHNCGWQGWDDFPPPKPFPDGDGVMGFRDGRIRNNGDAEPFWKEYAGACLISPLLADIPYRFQFDVGFVSAQKSPPINIVFYGAAFCNALPFGIGDREFGCPTNSPEWVKLGEVLVSGGLGDTWVNTFIEVVPDMDIYSIAIGPDCGPVRSFVSTYYFFDNLLLDNIESFDFRISEVLHPCNADFTLSVPDKVGFEYQWYKSGVALQGEIFSELTQIYGVGDYQVRIFDGSSCRVSAVYEYQIPIYNTAPRVVICQGEKYPFGSLLLSESGSYIDTLKTRNNCDSIVLLDLEVVGNKYDTLEVSILEGEVFEIGDQRISHEGEYPFTFTSSIGCDSLVYLKLSNFNVFIPNVFSPNNDGINDLFYPLAPEDEIISYQIQIFNRWGDLIYQGVEWDGSNLEPGVFVYAILIQFVQGNTNTFKGTITLLK